MVISLALKRKAAHSADSSTSVASPITAPANTAPHCTRAGPSWRGVRRIAMLPPPSRRFIPAGRAPHSDELLLRIHGHAYRHSGAQSRVVDASDAARAFDTRDNRCDRAPRRHAGADAR